MDKFICLLLLLTAIILISAGCTAQKQLSWENGQLIVNDKPQLDPFYKEYTNTIKFHLNNTNKDIVIKLMNNTPSARNFALQMPMNLKFQKYGDNEQISYLETKLTTDNSSQGFTPRRGDLCYYAPWGNIALFTKDGNFSHGLIKIGEVQEGMQYMDKMDKCSNISIDFTD